MATKLATKYPGPYFDQHVQSLRKLTNGWAGDGIGEAIFDGVFQKMFGLLKLLVDGSDSGISNPVIGATEEGGLQLQWLDCGVVVELVRNVSGGNNNDCVTLHGDDEIEIIEIEADDNELLPENIIGEKLQQVAIKDILPRIKFAAAAW